VGGDDTTRAAADNGYGLHYGEERIKSFRRQRGRKEGFKTRYETLFSTFVEEE
jgi:hypothetical protein